jgi:hypothetical protein
MARRFSRKPLTDEERDARRQADRERIEQAARALLTTEGWERWIKVRATNGLSKYSVTNLCPISATCHARGVTPTYVAGFRAFLNLNRVIRKGEAAIRILAPVTVKDRDERGEATGERRVFFRTVNVWDTLSRSSSREVRWCAALSGEGTAEGYPAWRSDAGGVAESSRRGSGAGVEVCPLGSGLRGCRPSVGATASSVAAVVRPLRALCGCPARRAGRADASSRPCR